MLAATCYVSYCISSSIDPSSPASISYQIRLINETRFKWLRFVTESLFPFIFMSKQFMKLEEINLYTMNIISQRWSTISPQCLWIEEMRYLMHIALLYLMMLFLYTDVYMLCMGVLNVCLLLSPNHAHYSDLWWPPLDFSKKQSLVSTEFKISAS